MDAGEQQRVQVGPDLEPDPVIDAYKRDVDRTLLREQLRRSVEERVRHMLAALRFADALREAGASHGSHPSRPRPRRHDR